MKSPYSRSVATAIAEHPNEARVSSVLDPG
jgi:hypothetical protein